MSSQSDHYRRLFSGTLVVLPIVFLNRALGGTLVHFLRDLPSNSCCLLLLVSLFAPKNAKHKTAPSDPNIKYIFAVPQPVVA